MRRLGRPVLVVACLLAAACAEPPNKEMNQAQGAIQAARAAGAERYAAEELAAAESALKRSEEAVAQDDYRLALNLAIDSFERAQTAARQAVEGQAQARGDAERAVAELAALVARAQTRLAAPEVTKLPRRTLAGARSIVADAEKALQEARSALGQHEYRAAIDAANDHADRVQAALAQIDQATSGRRSR